MTPDEIRRAGTLIFGASCQPALAEALGVSLSAMKKWLIGERTIPPGVRGEIVRLLRAHAQSCRAEADRIASRLGDLHGLTRRETQAIGWATSGDWLSDPEFPHTWTADRLRAHMRREIAGMRMADGEAAALMRAMEPLDDRAARDVLCAARDLDELTGGIVDD